MEQAKIIKNNKLISDFMDEPYDTEGRVSFIYEDSDLSEMTDEAVKEEVENDISKQLSVGFYIEVKSYHNSWDWLMTVVEKIEDFNSGTTLCIIEDERCHIDTQNGFYIDSVGHTKIEATYNSVLKFIKWYNKNKEV